MRGSRFALRPDAEQEAALTDLGIARRLAYNSARELIEEVYGFLPGSDPQISEAIAAGGHAPWRYLDTFSLNKITNALRHSGVYGNSDRVPVALVEEAVVDACRAHKRWVDSLGQPGRKVGKPGTIPYGDDLTFRIRKGADISLATKDSIKLPGIAKPIAVLGLTRWLIKQLAATEGRIRLVTIKREADIWYAAVVVEREQLEPDRITEASELDLIISRLDGHHFVIPFELRADVVGGDLGLTTLLTLSDGTEIANPRFLRRSRRRLRALNKAVSRAERRRYAACWRLAVAHDPVKWAKEAELLKLDPATGRGLSVPPAYWRGQVPRSRNLLELLAKARRLHIHIANQRQAYALLVAARIARGYAAVGLETLNITGLMANSRLSRSIADAGWGKLTCAIESSLIDHGRILVRHAATYPSSQLCSGYLPDGSKCPGRMKLRLSERTYICPICDLVIGRDFNAAINLRPTRDQMEKAILARADATTTYNAKLAARAAKAVAAAKTNAARIQAKTERKAAAIAAASNPDSNATEQSVATVDRVTWETQNWPSEGATNQEGLNFPMRQSPETAIIAVGSGRTEQSEFSLAQLANLSAESTG
jgi:transposase